MVTITLERQTLAGVVRISTTCSAGGESEAMDAIAEADLCARIRFGEPSPAGATGKTAIHPRLLGVLAAVAVALAAGIVAMFMLVRAM